MAHVCNPTRGDPGNGWLLAVSSSVGEEDVGSCGDDQTNACQQQQGAACLVEHGVELLMLVLGTAQKETATWIKCVHFVSMTVQGIGSHATHKMHQCHKPRQKSAGMQCCANAHPQVLFCCIILQDLADPNNGEARNIGVKLTLAAAATSKMIAAPHLEPAAGWTKWIRSARQL